jgi:hypothetical protein
MKFPRLAIIEWMTIVVMAALLFRVLREIGQSTLSQCR